MKDRALNRHNSKAVASYVARHYKWHQEGLITREEYLRVVRKANRLATFKKG